MTDPKIANHTDSTPEMQSIEDEMAGVAICPWPLIHFDGVQNSGCFLCSAREHVLRCYSFLPRDLP